MVGIQLDIKLSDSTQFLIYSINSLLILQKFMAFVFRKQKDSLFLSKNDSVHPPQPSSITNQQSQLNGTTYSNLPSNQSSVSPSKILKGLPSLLTRNPLLKSDNFKQNDLFQQAKPKTHKPNIKPQKKILSNYFFSSNVPRDINKCSSKPLDRSSTCSQFNSSTNDEFSILQQNKPLMTNYLAKNPPFNKNILSIQDNNAKHLRNPPTQSKQHQNHKQQIFINCSKNLDPSIKRKSSPPHSIDKILYNSVLHKLKQKKQQSQQNCSNQHGQFYMKTLEDTYSLKKCQTQKRLSKLHKASFQSSFYKDSETQASNSDEEEEDQTTPGPGSYDNTMNLKKMKSFRSKKEKFTKIFGSPVERFKKQEVKYHEVTYVNQENPAKPQKIRKNHVFLSNTPKFVPLENKSKSPEPGFYNPRESLEHDIVRNLLRNANIASFNSTLPRFKQEKSNLTPGPGQYNVDCLEMTKLQEIRNNLSSNYKSQVQRCIDYVKQNPSNQKNSQVCTFQGLMDEKHKNYVIHKRQQLFDSSEFFSPPAFFSGVQRFKEIQKKNPSPVVSSSFPSKTLDKEQKNVQPFNSSEDRKLSQTVGQGVGVGSYRVDKDRWNKKSYNIFFH